MPNSISVHFRPVETKITESLYDSTGAFYRIETKVKFFTDEAMTKLAYGRDFVFENVPYELTWDWILAELYELITKNI